jgi:hypothetical protein
MEIFDCVVIFPTKLRDFMQAFYVIEFVVSIPSQCRREVVVGIT